MTATRTKTTTTRSQKTDNETYLLTEALNNLNNRIEKTEADFIGHLQKVEDRLDQIVELTKTVAVLQTQTSQQTDQITEIRAYLRDSSAKFETSVSRIHTRLDEITTHGRDRMELHSKEVELNIKTVKEVSDRTEKDLRQWLNRGLGAWFILVLVFGSVQALTTRWVDNIEKEKVVIKTDVDKMKSEHIMYDQKFQGLEVIARENSANTKKLIEGQRDLEDLVIRQRDLKK
jgi:small-conductance mechanosensitive channel